MATKRIYFGFDPDEIGEINLVTFLSGGFLTSIDWATIDEPYTSYSFDADNSMFDANVSFVVKTPDGEELDSSEIICESNVYADGNDPDLIAFDIDDYMEVRSSGITYYDFHVIDKYWKCEVDLRNIDVEGIEEVRFSTNGKVSNSADRYFCGNNIYLTTGAYYETSSSSQNFYLIADTNQRLRLTAEVASNYDDSDFIYTWYYRVGSASATLQTYNGQTLNLNSEIENGVFSQGQIYIRLEVEKAEWKENYDTSALAIPAYNTGTREISYDINPYTMAEIEFIPYEDSKLTININADIFLYGGIYKSWKKKLIAGTTFDIDTGYFTTTIIDTYKIDESNGYKTISLSANVEADTNYLLCLRPYTATDSQESLTVTLTFSEKTNWQEAIIKVYNNNAWHTAIPYVYNNGAWHEAAGYVYRES